MFYGIIAIHDVPYRIAEARHHPHQDAIHAAGWVSLFTLHVLWPFLWIWAMVYRPERGWGLNSNSNALPPAHGSSTAGSDLADLRQRLMELERRQSLAEVERTLPVAKQAALAQHKAQESIDRSVPLEEDIVLPATHAEKDLPQQGKVVHMPGVDSNLPRSEKG